MKSITIQETKQQEFTKALRLLQKYIYLNAPPKTDTTLSSMLQNVLNMMFFADTEKLKKVFKEQFSVFLYWLLVKVRLPRRLLLDYLKLIQNIIRNKYQRYSVTIDYYFDPDIFKKSFTHKKLFQTRDKNIFLRQLAQSLKLDAQYILGKTESAKKEIALPKPSAPPKQLMEIVSEPPKALSVVQQQTKNQTTTDSKTKMLAELLAGKTPTGQGKGKATQQLLDTVAQVVQQKQQDKPSGQQQRVQVVQQKQQGKPSGQQQRVQVVQQKQQGKPSGQQQTVQVVQQKQQGKPSGLQQRVQVVQKKQAPKVVAKPSFLADIALGVPKLKKIQTPVQQPKVVGKPSFLAGISSGASKLKKVQPKSPQTKKPTQTINSDFLRTAISSRRRAIQDEQEQDDQQWK